MRVMVTGLRHWKEERNSKPSPADDCEDAYAADADRGLFAVADGVSSAAFSATWAHILVDHFTAKPLLTADPFEAAFWLEPSQALFSKQVPAWRDLPMHAQPKARRGSDATLASLRAIKTSQHSASLRLLVCGDSVVFLLGTAAGKLDSFSYTRIEEFKRNPICLPTQAFNPAFHVPQASDVEVQAGDVAVLATDAVAKWVIGHPSPVSAIRSIIECKPTGWMAWVEERRRSPPAPDQPQLEDDDSTALVIHFLADGTDKGTPLGLTSTVLPAGEADRRLHEATEAITRLDRVRAAVIIGDPVWGLAPDGFDLEAARKVAKALSSLLALLSTYLQADSATGQAPHAEQIRELWQRHAQILVNEPAAQPAIRTLHDLRLVSNTKRSVPGPDDVQDVPTSTVVSPPSASAANDIAPKDQFEATRTRTLVRVLEAAVTADNDEAILRATYDLPEDTPELEPLCARIELARGRTASYRRLRVALGTEEDDQIADAYSDLAKVCAGTPHPLTDVERDRVDLAQRRLDAAHLIRAALHTGDPASIVKAYDPVLDLSSLLTEAERQTIASARGRLDTFSRLRLLLSEGGKEAEISEALEQLHPTDTMALAPDERQAAERARGIVVTLRRLDQALSAENDQAIVEASDHLASVLEGPTSLTDEVRKRIGLARARLHWLILLRAALSEEVSSASDRRIMDVCDAHPDILNACPSLRPEERARIDVARVRQTFAKALATDDDQQIVDCYDTRLDQPSFLDDNARARLVLARRRLHAVRTVRDALRGGDPLALLLDGSSMEIALSALTVDEVRVCFGAHVIAAGTWLLRKATDGNRDEDIVSAWELAVETCALVTDRSAETGERTIVSSLNDSQRMRLIEAQRNMLQTGRRRHRFWGR